MLIALNTRVINKTKDYTTLNSMFQNMELTPRELIDHIIDGHAFCTGVLQENKDGFCIRKNDNFIESSVIAIDIDNATQTMDEYNATTKGRVSDEEYLTYESILQDDFIRKNASFVYTTASSTDDWNRFRIVFILQTPILNKEAHSNLFKSLNNMYLGDDATSANSQIFYGSKDASSEFFGNLLSDEIVKKLSIITEYDNSGRKPISYKKGLDLKLFDKEEISKILQFVFKNGKLPNHKWWKVPTILKNTGLFTDEEIIELIEANIGDTNDVKSKIRYAHRYKDSLSIGTLIHFAKETDMNCQVQ
jgi:hypothetical protein